MFIKKLFFKCVLHIFPYVWLLSIPTDWCHLVDNLWQWQCPTIHRLPWVPSLTLSILFPKLLIVSSNSYSYSVAAGQFIYSMSQCWIWDDNITRQWGALHAKLVIIIPYPTSTNGMIVLLNTSLTLHTSVLFHWYFKSTEDFSVWCKWSTICMKIVAKCLVQCSIGKLWSY